MNKALELISKAEETTLKLIALHSNLEVIAFVVGNEERAIDRKTQDDLYGALDFTNGALLDIAGNYELLIQELKGEIKHG